MRTIGEVSSAFGIKPHVLRYWEQQFPMLRPLKRSGGRRLYRAADIALVERIDILVNKRGYTLKGAKKALIENPEKTGAGDTSAPEIPGQEHANRDADALARLYSIRNRLSDAVSR
ncbi:MerR family transcriptional regulator [Aurantiacibacter poecillastricola]|uniref:MerR family transcriptional regulator n=1 Tax=Aurantiacibacter poecillastricola TaxID=3064385 RepID=UPI00273D3728|nr:MerR family transcriptional regulator [Aurantiacibacter sp. 219JJ12-13]MDP5262625.1 MerR family transcriptional regulator [Aurantiacibacter sp. 219JJ12-13]